MKVLLLVPAVALGALAITAQAATTPAAGHRAVTVAPVHAADTDLRAGPAVLQAPATVTVAPVAPQALPQPPLERGVLAPAVVAPERAVVPARSCTSAGKVAPACAPA